MKHGGTAIFSCSHRANVFSEHRHVVAGDVLGHGHAGQLHDAALDGVHEREVAHRPREEGALRVAGAAQEERGGGEVDDSGQAELAIHRLQPGDPEAGGLVVALGLLAVVALQILVVVRGGLLAVAVMGLDRLRAVSGVTPQWDGFEIARH
jgi:hypothetical protein